jgi:hypothetical protein
MSIDLTEKRQRKEGKNFVWIFFGFFIKRACKTNADML